MISCAYPKAQFLPHKDEILAAIQSVLNSGNYILGEEVSRFETEFAQYLGIDNAIGCASGTDALVLAMRALDIGPGHEVIVPSHTATATVAAVAQTGATPVFADIDPDLYTLDVSAVDAVCTNKTKAIIAVHLYGQAADLDGLLAITKRRGLFLFEDCAQSTGASFHDRKLGTMGDIGCFSFFPTKNLGALGDGGAVVCSDNALAARIRRLRQYGWDDNRLSLEPGMNSRLDELQAAILRVKLPRLDADNAERREQAEYYRTGLAGLPIGLPSERDDALHVYHLFVIRTQDRDGLIQYLKQKDIFAGIHYAVPAHLMPSFKGKGRLPVTEKIVNEIFSLPLYPGLGELAQSKVVSAVRGFFSCSPSHCANP